jgi:hypothetical protein
MVIRETDPAYFRPKTRRLKHLSNEELQQLFELRSSKIKVDPKGFWDNNQIVYWNEMIPKLDDLYEVLLEIQSRYPKSEIYANDSRLLPVKTPKEG